MSNPTGGYTEVQECNRDREEYNGVRIGLLTYNDPSETYSTYSQCNFNEAYKKGFGKAPGENLPLVGYYRNMGNEPVQARVPTPNRCVPELRPDAPRPPTLPGTELRDTFLLIAKILPLRCWTY